MAAYDIDLLHRRILRILMAVDRCCQEHHLRYYIWAGTMIGAVRHKGFIPWDDDIDIAMPRPDYEQLIAHSGEWLPQPFEFVCAENDEQYPLPFGKVQDASTTLIERLHLRYLGGIYIDVFPIDAVPEGCFAASCTSPATNFSSACSICSIATPISTATAHPAGCRCCAARCTA